jgi:peptidyl-prolyl cis-trans isomerase SurA
MYKSMHFTYSAIILVMLALSESLLAQRVLLDKVIAIVDEDVVLQSEVDIRVTEIQAQAQRANQPLPEDFETFKSEIIEALVIENIQMQLAERVSIRFDDDTINRILGNMANNNNMSFDDYVNTLENAGVYLETREQVRKQMTIQELQRGMVNRRITITQQEINNFLNSQMGREMIAADYFLEHVLIPISAGDSADVLEKKAALAANIISEAKQSANLRSAVSDVKNSYSLEIGGTEFGWRKAKQLPGIFSDLVVSMELGGVSNLIKAGNGLHIIQLVDKRGGTEQFVNQTRIRHIMLSPNEIRDEAQAEREIRQLRQRVLDGEDFATLARQNSDDASSVVAGGDLDWVNEGGMPPAMEKVLNELEVDEVSESFRTDGGWHVAKVEGRRLQDLSSQYMDSQAESALRNRKFDLELQNWLLEIREEAFVEFID